MSAVRNKGSYITIKTMSAQFLAVQPEAVRRWFKRTVELLFWKKHLRQLGGAFGHGHLEQAFTRCFDVDRAFFSGKAIADIGCGPAGSLEWATDARSRTGVDPLADQYVRLNGGTQTMRYVVGLAERIPLEDASQDIVSLFNALDHVENVDQAIAEAQRILRPGGSLLLMVEIDHAPTITEPHWIDEGIVARFKDSEPVFQRIYRIRSDHDIYASLFQAVPRATEGEPALLVARLVKRG